MSLTKQTLFVRKPGYRPETLLEQLTRDKLKLPQTIPKSETVDTHTMKCESSEVSRHLL